MIVFEERQGAVVNRTKVAYHLRNGKLEEAGLALTHYTPLSEGELSQYLEDLGFEHIRSTQRPGRWPMTAILARRPE